LVANNCFRSVSAPEDLVGGKQFLKAAEKSCFYQGTIFEAAGNPVLYQGTPLVGP
jgi:hypothetical protein